MKKFKSGDFVENLLTGEIEMISETQIAFANYWVKTIKSQEHRWRYAKIFKKISPKKIKFNLK